MQAFFDDSLPTFNQATTQTNWQVDFFLKPNVSSIFLKSPVKTGTSYGQNEAWGIFYGINEISDRVVEMFQKLNRIEQLRSNWDSYDAIPPSSTAIDLARSFLIKNHGLSLPFYFLAPGVNGEVMIEFSNPPKAAELYFLPDGQDELILLQMMK
ncbi:MAG: hypothetical protein HC913_18605 [Microscillaceae bacterium]|nr:hypothetical protein [Microscillaceae bacterium]